MRLCLLFIILLISVTGYSQERKYFTKFKPTEYVYGDPTFGNYYGEPLDTLQIRLNNLKTKLVRGMECTLFELCYNGDKVTFWLGVKDSVMYTFNKNKLRRPVKMFDFRQKVTELKNVSLLPFLEKCTVTEPFAEVVDNDRYFSVVAEESILLGGLCFNHFYISLNRGFFFTTTSPDYELTYTNLEEL